jgi:hypothetical protein
MGRGTQSEDKKEYRATELEQIINTSEIWFDNLVLPKMEKAIDDKFKLYVVPLQSQVNQHYRSINVRLFIKTLAFLVIIGLMILFSYK